MNNLLELSRSSSYLDQLNKILEKETHLYPFFSNDEARQEFIYYLTKIFDENKAEEREYKNSNGKKKKEKEEMGDFQTPSTFTDKICEYLKKKGLTPKILIEPTCGNGSFIFSALKYFPSIRRVYCLDIQPKYEFSFKTNLWKFMHEAKSPINKQLKIEFHRDNIFTHKFSDRLIDEISTNPFLVIGNPPWVTNSALERINSSNIPVKSNFRKLSGMDSMTGKSNFDIAESIIIKLFKNFGQYHGYFAMLCKPIIVRNILKDKSNQRLKISNLQSFQIDSKKFFKVNAPACLFCADLGDKGNNICKTSFFKDELTFNNSHNNQSEETKTKKFGWQNGKFIADIELYQESKKFDGKCPFVWRQGVKHDLSKIMTLTPYCEGNIGKYTNGFGKEISLENEIIYPFLKSSDLQKPISQKARHSIIITQKKIGESTDYIKIKCPLIWKYLHQYRLNFDQRKSRIYRNQPHFALFGIGPYAFAPYKVAISGFYKNGNFMLIEPESAKPVMTDDTSYFISFQKRSNAIFIWLILNLPEIKTLLSSIIFPTAKRPYTKEVLMRLDLQAIVADYSYIKFQNIFQSDPYLEYAKDITEKEFLNLKNQFFVS